MPPSIIIEPSALHPPSGAHSGRERERINVCLRLRPLNRAEVQDGDIIGWKVERPVTIRYTGPPEMNRQRNLPTEYHYDQVYDIACPSREVYETSCKQLVLSSMQGLNSTIFAYGPTGSGKTYTMSSIMELAAQEIFSYILENPDREFVLRVSALEIYNESVRDLLRDKGEPVNCFDHPERGLIIEGLTEEGVESAKHLLQMIRAVERRRHVRDTRLNESSSRSHQIVRLHIESSPRVSSPVPDLADLSLSTELDLTRVASASAASPLDRNVMIAQLNFVDLAGSERAKAAGLEDQFESLRMKEGSHINQSLLTLGKVIRKLGEREKGAHVPFRESKLTRLLQPSLGGNSKTAIVCCISPGMFSIENTRATLHFAQAAKRVTTAPRVNKVLDDKTIIRQLHDEIATLRRQLALVDTEQLSQRLQAIQHQAKMTAEERDAATKRLKNLEKLILRAPPGAVRRRASWSPGLKAPPPVDLELSSEDDAWAHVGSESADDDTTWLDEAGEGGPRRGRARGRGGRQAQSLRSSWNPGDPARVPPAAAPEPRAPRRFRYGEPLFLDLFLTPKVASKVRSLYASSESARSPRALARARAAPPTTTTSTELATRLRNLDGLPQGRAERAAIEALRAEVHAMKHGGSALWSEASEEDTALTITCLTQELQRMEHEAVIGEFLDQSKEDMIRFLRAELERLTGTLEAKVAAEDAVASLEERVRNLPLQLDMEAMYEAGLAALGPLPTPLEWEEGDTVLFDSRAPSMEGGGGGGSAATTPSRNGRHSRRPTLTLELDLDKENSQAAATAGVLESPAAGLRQNSGNRRALGNSMENMPLAALKKLGKAGISKTSSGEGRSASQQAAAAWQAAQEWYRSELLRVQGAFQEETEADLESIKACLTEYREGASRLNCQKKFLLNRVMLLEYTLREAQATEAALQNELDDTKASLEDAQYRAQEAAARARKAEAAAAALGTPRTARSPLEAAARSGHGLPGTPHGLTCSTPSAKLTLNGLTMMSEGLGDEYWADEPSEENLLPRILRLWDELQVPLRHRSRFLLAFRGKETFYYEAEERRLMWLKSKMQSEGLSHAERMKMLGTARATLERERKALARMMKQKISEAQRANLFQAWGIPVDSKARKLQLTFKLWSSESLQSRELLTKASELIVKLYGDDLAQNTEELVFFGSDLKSGMRNAVGMGVF